MISLVSKKIINLSIISSSVIALSLSGCSGDKQAEEPVEPTAEAGAEPEAPAPADAAPKAEIATPEAAPAPAVTETPAPAAQAPTSTVTFNASRRVMYVKVDGAVMRDKPDPKATALGKLSKGDHMLVSIEGEWARTDDGKYVSMKVLSEKGVGRAKRGATWSGGSPSEAPSSKTSKKSSTPAATEGTPADSTK